MSTSSPSLSRGIPAGARMWAKTAGPEQPALPHASTIKWFDPVRRFGFVTPHDGGGDIWFNWLTLLKNRIDEADVLPDMAVRFSYADPETVGQRRSIVNMKFVV